MLKHHQNRLLVVDLMIVVVCVAFSLLLLRDDAQLFGSRPQPGQNGRLESSQARAVWGPFGRVLSDRTEWMRAGLPLVLWYFLLGPTMSGAFIAYVHRRRYDVRWPPTMRVIWGLFGSFLLIQVLSLYLPIYLLGATNLDDLRQTHALLLGSREGVLLICFVLNCFFLLAFSALPLALLILAFEPTLIQRFLRKEPSWMERVGVLLFCLWAIRSMLFIYWYCARYCGLIELP